MSVRGRLAFGFLDLLAACLVAIGVFRGLPSRVWAIDGCAAAVIAMLAVSGVGLMLGRKWAPRVARAGKGGAVILVLVAALGLPYLVALPASQLLWLGRPGPR